MARRGAKSTFTKESDLCAAFIAALRPEWTAYAETCGWDILLVRNSDGFQIGIEAKLRLNAEVLNQACAGDNEFAKTGPDCRAVLVPAASGLAGLAARIGITVITLEARYSSYSKAERAGHFRIEPDLPGRDAWLDQHWYEWAPQQRHALPDYVPDVAAGSRAPVQLTPWKIGAIKISVILDRLGYVSRSDFRHVGISHSRWMTPGGWLKQNPEGDGWIAAAIPDFRAQHPKNYAEIAADFDLWKPPARPIAAPPEKTLL